MNRRNFFKAAITVCAAIFLPKTNPESGQFPYKSDIVKIETDEYGVTYHYRDGGMIWYRTKEYPQYLYWSKN